MQRIEEILNFIQANRLNVSQTEREAGIKAGRMDKWLRGFGRPKAEDSGKLQNWYELYKKPSEKVPKDAPEKRFKADPGAEVSTGQIAGLIESNRMMAAAMLADAENRSRLTKSNEQLTIMVKQFENGQQEIPEAFQSKLAGVLVFLSEVAAGKRYKSEVEASAILSKLFYDGPGKKKGKDIQHGLDK